MKNLIIVILIGVVALLLRNQLTVPVKVVETASVPSSTPTQVTQPSTEKAAQEPTPDERIPSSFRDLAQKHGIPAKGLKQRFDAAIATVEPVRLFKGVILQHLKDGDLLINVWTVKPSQKCVPQGTFALFGVPNADSLADQLEIDCMVVPVGTYQFVSTDGALRTIYEMMYVPGESRQNQPTPTPESASTPRSMFPPGVDTPEQRRAYLQEWAIERKKQRQLESEQ